MPTRYAVSLAALLLLARSATGQSVKPAPSAEIDKQNVVATVERLFAAMKTRDTVTLRLLMAPDVVIVSSREVNGQRTVRRQLVPQFLTTIANSAEELRERMWTPEVKVDGAIATLWAPYDFHIGTRLSHCGHDAFHLVRNGDRWVITALTYTVVNAPCTSPPDK